MTAILVYVTGGKFLLPDAIRKAYATADIVSPMTGEVLAEAGYVHPFQAAGVIDLSEGELKAYWTDKKAAFYRRFNLSYFYGKPTFERVYSRIGGKAP